jgi:ribokinase
VNGHIVVVGSLNMDLVVRAPHHPEPGETIIGSDFGVFPGGKGANQAVAAARLGASVKMVGCVGNDSFGRALIATLTQDQVDATHIRTDPVAATGVAVITVSAAGQNTIVVASGANARLTPADVDAAESLFVGASVLLLQLESPLAAVVRAVELAHEHGVHVVLNPAPAQPLEDAMLARVDYLVPNQIELSLLTGMGADADPARAAAALRARGPRHVVVTLGESGVLVLDDRPHLLARHPVTVVDTTAAGDAFVGAFAVALALGKPDLEAAAWGNAAGALAVTRAGAQPSLPDRHTFDEFLAGISS